VGVRRAVASAQPLDSRAFLPRRLADRSRSARPVRPRPTAIFPDGGSIMHFIQHEKTKQYCFAFAFLIV
ncbi:hypothetical protein, partial [Hafnia paralvei]|uniref:hypothetical protein n=1 Tax=Hafnia paralvei TaxID=546367 RepID=UPI001C698525